MNNQSNSSSKAPLIIIGLVLLAAVAGGWWFYSQSKAGSKPANANRAANAGRQPVTTNVQGATPPHLLGSPTASVTVEEFADYQCGACAAVHPRVKEIVSTYGSRIKFIYRNYPLPSHDKAYDMAVAAEAAGLQGRFWDMQNLIFTNQQAWATSSNHRQMLEEYAQKIGLDVEKFKSDMASTMAKQRVDADLARGRALNVRSTPSIYINGYSIPYEQMTVDGLRQIIDAELQKTAGATTQNAPTAAAPANAANSAANANK